MKLVHTLLVVSASLANSCVSGEPAATPPNTPIESNGARYTVTLADASTPIHRGVNDVMLTVRGLQTDGAAVVTLRAWMPAHGHEVYPVSIVADSPGVFVARGLAVTMPGEWAIDVGLAPADAAPIDDRATLWASVD